MVVHLSRTLPLSPVPPLRPLHLAQAGSCAEVAWLEGLWRKGAEGEQLLEVWGEWMPHCMERRGVLREGSETGQLFRWEEEEEAASNYLHALIASSVHTYIYISVCVLCMTCRLLGLGPDDL